MSAQLIMLFFAFVFILVAVAAGAALFTMNPQQQATFITLVIGVLDLLAGAALWLVIWWDPPMPAEVRPEELQAIALWSTVEGVVYVGLAVGIARRDKLCALLSAGLSSLTTVLYLVIADAPSMAGVVVRFVLLAILWRAFLQLRGDLAHEEQLAQRRRDLDRLQLAPSRGAEPAPAEFTPRSEPPSARSRRHEPVPSASPLLSTAPLPPSSTGRPSGKLIGKRGAPPPIEDPASAEQGALRGAARVCPNCQRTYAEQRERCEQCNVVLYEA